MSSFSLQSTTTLGPGGLRPGGWKRSQAPTPPPSSDSKTEKERAPQSKGNQQRSVESISSVYVYVSVGLVHQVKDRYLLQVDETLNKVSGGHQLNLMKGRSSWRQWKILHNQLYLQLVLSNS